MSPERPQFAGATGRRRAEPRTGWVGRRSARRTRRSAEDRDDDGADDGRVGNDQRPPGARFEPRSVTRRQQRVQRFETGAASGPVSAGGRRRDRCRQARRVRAAQSPTDRAQVVAIVACRLSARRCPGAIRCTRPCRGPTSTSRRSTTLGMATLVVGGKRKTRCAVGACAPGRA
jgi:hypothetical protein